MGKPNVEVRLKLSEYESILNEIKSLKDENSKLKGGAPVVERIVFNHISVGNFLHQSPVSNAIAANKLIEVGGRFVGEASDRGVEFEGVDVLIDSLSRQVDKIAVINNSERLATNKLKEVMNRNLWRRILNKQ
jgi:hypothetical protein